MSQPLKSSLVDLKYTKMCLNTQTYEFKITSGKPLAYTVIREGIEVDPSVIKDTQDMLPPKTKKEI